LAPSAHAQSSSVAAAPPASLASIESQFSIPTGYGDDRIVLMVKDPWWLHAYWEIQASTERAARSHLLPDDIPGLQSVLRVYDVTGLDYPAQPAHRWFDIPLSGLATNWYIHTNAPDRSFIVEIGILTRAGRFLLLARSNRITTPRASPSDVIDERWMTTDELFARLAGLGLRPGSSPSGWLQMVPGSWSSAAMYGVSRTPAVRGFWYRIDTDLVIHGATEPRATVIVQGQPVPVRKDGSFSLRLAMPTGTQTIEIQVTSPNGQVTRTATPIVTLEWSGVASSALGKPSLRASRSRPHRQGEGSVPA
jgi:hypothetical protein